MYRVFHKTVKGVRKLYPVDKIYDVASELIEKDPNSDYYESIYIYNSEAYDQLKKTKSLAGIRDIKTDRLVWDFDSKENMELALDDTKELIDRILPYFKEENIRVFFSGNKGMHVEVHLTESITREQFEKLISNFAGDLETFDTTVKDQQRLFRFPLTKNVKTGLIKIPLTFEELDASVEEIKSFASEENIDFDLRSDILNSYEVEDLPEELRELSLSKSKKEEVNKEVDAQDFPDMSRKPKHLTAAKYVLQEGFFNEGERNEACMILATTYKYLGYNKETTYNIIKATLRLRQDRLGLPDYDKEELWNTIVNPVYSPTWKGGTYTEEDGLLKATIERYNLGKSYDDSDVSLIGLNDLTDRFKNFAANIDKNTIKTGIDEIDRKVRLTTGSLVVLVAAPSAGKCLGKDTPVRMFDGSIKMSQDIKVGDILMGDDSTPRKVLSTTTGSEELFRVDQENGDSYVVNKSHILSLKCVANFNDPSKAKKYKYNETVDVEVADYLNKDKYWKKYYKGYKVGVEYPEQEITLDPYILGVWLGDGTASKPQITNPDSEIINYFDKYFSQFNLSRKNYSIDITHDYTNKKGEPNWFMQQLRGYEVLNNKHIPNKYLINSTEVRRQLLAGLIDSDGYIDGTKGEITFKDKLLATQTLELIRSLGIKGTMNEKNAKYKSFTKGKLYEGTSLCYRIYFAGKELINIPTKVQRKKVFSDVRSTEELSTGIKLTSLGEGNYYGFEIDGNRRFLLGDFTVTHNTSISCGILNSHSNNNEEAVFYSMDMGADQVFQRLIQKHTGHDEDTVFNNFKNNRVAQINEYTKILGEEYKNIKFCFKTSLTPEGIEASLEQEFKRTGKYPKLILLDYLECIQTGISDPTQAKAVAALKLKDIANKYSICVFLLSQPAKLAGGPAGELNNYTQIKGSGVVGEQASVVLSLSRPGFDPKHPENDNFVTINVLKNRMGKLSTTDLHWEGLTGHIRSLTNEEMNDLKALRAEIAKEKSAKNDRDLY